MNNVELNNLCSSVSKKLLKNRNSNMFNGAPDEELAQKVIKQFREAYLNEQTESQWIIASDNLGETTSCITREYNITWEYNGCEKVPKVPKNDLAKASEVWAKSYDLRTGLFSELFSQRPETLPHEADKLKFNEKVEVRLFDQSDEEVETQSFDEEVEVLLSKTSQRTDPQTTIYENLKKPTPLSFFSRMQNWFSSVVNAFSTFGRILYFLFFPRT